MGFFSNLWDTITKNPLKILIDPIGTVTRGVVTEATGLSDVQQAAIALPIAATFAGPLAATAVSAVAPGGMRPPIRQPKVGGEMPFSLTNVGTRIGSSLVDAAELLAIQAGRNVLERNLGGGNAVAPVPQQQVGLVTRVPGFIGGGAASGAIAAGGIAARSALGIIKAKVALALGKRMSIRRISQIIKRLGPSVASIALGLTAVEIAQIMASSPARRARGISASNIRVTKRTIKKIIGVACQVQQVGTIKVSGMRRGCK